MARPEQSKPSETTSPRPKASPDSLPTPLTPEGQELHRRIYGKESKIPADAEVPTPRTPEAQQVLNDLQNNPDVITKRIQAFLEE